MLLNIKFSFIKLSMVLIGVAGLASVELNASDKVLTIDSVQHIQNSQGSFTTLSFKQVGSKALTRQIMVQFIDSERTTEFFPCGATMTLTSRKFMSKYQERDLHMDEECSDWMQDEQEQIVPSLLGIDEEIVEYFVNMDTGKRTALIEQLLIEKNFPFLNRLNESLSLWSAHMRQQSRVDDYLQDRILIVEYWAKEIESILLQREF